MFPPLRKRTARLVSVTLTLAMMIPPAPAHATNYLPSVQITSPASGPHDPGSLSIEAFASDYSDTYPFYDGSIAVMEVYADGVLIGSATVPHITATWNTTGLTGDHRIEVKARDWGSPPAWGSSSVTVSFAEPIGEPTTEPSGEPTSEPTPPEMNQAPSAEAGAPITITVNTRANLDGRGYDDGRPYGYMTYEWTKKSGPGTVDFSNAYSAAPSAGFTQAGPYVLSLTVSDGALRSSPSDVAVTVNPYIPPNTAPTANPQSVQTNLNTAQSITLSGSDTEGNPLTYFVFAFPTRGTLSGTAPNLVYTPTHNLTGPDNFAFKVHDGTVYSLPATVSVNVINNNTGPTAYAGGPTPITTTVSSKAHLHGTANDDGLPDGLLTYKWTIKSGPPGASLTGDSSPDTSAEFSSPGTYVFRLAVSDGFLSDDDEVAAIVSSDPRPGIFSITASNFFVEENVGTLTVTILRDGTDGDVSVDLATQPSLPVSALAGKDYTGIDTTLFFKSGETSKTYNVLINADNDPEGSETFTLALANPTNGASLGAGASRTITIWNSNHAPVANPQTVEILENVSKAVTLTGSDQDGSPLTYATLTNPTLGTLTGTAPNLLYTPYPGKSGTDSFKFKVNDGFADSPPAEVTLHITHVNQPPIANAQSVQTNLNTAQSITLSGSDIEGSPLTYFVFAFPTRGTLSGTAPNLVYTPTRNLTGPDNFAFKVHDGTVYSLPATVSVNVINNNTAPTVNAGPDATVLWTNKARLDGSVSDDGIPNPMTCSWSGPAGVSFVDASDPKTQAKFSTWGTYVLTLTASDGLASASKSVTIIANKEPTALPGAYFSVEIPGDKTSVTTTLNGSFTDDRTPEANMRFQWSQIDGPDVVSIVNPDTLHPTVTFNKFGVARLQLLVDDKEGGVGSDRTLITVTKQMVVDAGPYTIVNWKEGAQLNGSVTDDGIPRPASYSWSKKSGPLDVTFVNPSSLTAQAKFTGSGTYVLTLTATDGVTTVSDDVTIGANRAPDAHTGFLGPTTVTLPSKLHLYGWVGDDGLPTTTIHSLWTKTSGPGTVTFDDGTAPNTHALFSTAGVYTLTLTASDEFPLSGSESLVVTVYPAPQPGSFSLTASNLFVEENAGKATVTIQRDAADVDASVDLVSQPSMPVSAVAGKDYTAVNTTLSFKKGELSKTFEVLINTDFDPESSETFILALANPTNGASLKKDSSQLTMTIWNSNHAPVANAQTVNLSEDAGPTAVTLTGSDPDNSPLTYTKINDPDPTLGTLTGTAPNLVFTPLPHKFGTTSFNFKVNDTYADSPPALVTLNINHVNRPPVVNAGAAQTIKFPKKALLKASATDPDQGPSPLSFQWKGTGPGPVTFANAKAPETTAEFVVPGQHTLTLSASDGVATVNSSMVVTVKPVVFVEGSIYGFLAESWGTGGSNSIKLALNESSSEAVTVDYEIRPAATNEHPASEADFTREKGTLTIPPGEKLITVPVSVANDGDAEFWEYIEVVLSNPKNAELGDSPDLPSTKEFGIQDNDRALDAPRITIDTPKKGDTVTGVVDISATADAYDPSDIIDYINFYLDKKDVAHKLPSLSSKAQWDTKGVKDGSSHKIIAVAIDSNELEAEDSVTVRLPTPDNLPPLVKITAPTNNNVITKKTVSIAVDASDPGGSVSRVEIWIDNTVKLKELTQPPYQVDWFIALAEKKTHTITAKAFDNLGLSAQDTITIDYQGTRPEALPQTLTTKEDTPLNIVLTGRDDDGDSLIFKEVSTPTQGTLSGTAPNLIYTPKLNAYDVTASFTFKVNDSRNDSAPATISINVTPVNDAPTVVDKAMSTDKGKAQTLTFSAADVTDVDSTAFTFAVTQPAHGTVAGTTPTFTYTPAKDYVGADSFAYKANDGALDSAPGTVNVTVNPPAADTTPPTVPTLTATANGCKTVSVSWTASTDAESPMKGYELFRDGSSIQQLGLVTSFSDSVGEHSAHTYWVLAMDKPGNKSAISNKAAVTTESCTDTVPPVIVSIQFPNAGYEASTSFPMRVVAQDNKNQLREVRFSLKQGETITEDLKSDTTGENVKEADGSAEYQSADVTIDKLTVGQTYTLVAVAYDKDGNQSLPATRTFKRVKEEIAGPISIKFDSLPSTAKEGESLILAVKRTGGTAAPVSVKWDVVPVGNTRPGVDYSLFQSENLPLGKNQTQLISIPILSDKATEIEEFEESLKVVLHGDGIVATYLHDPKEALVTLVDDGQGCGIFQFGEAGLPYTFFQSQATYGRGHVDLYRVGVEKLSNQCQSSLRVNWALAYDEKNPLKPHIRTDWEHDYFSGGDKEDFWDPAVQWDAAVLGMPYKVDLLITKMALGDDREETNIMDQFTVRERANVTFVPPAMEFEKTKLPDGTFVRTLEANPPYENAKNIVVKVMRLGPNNITVHAKAVTDLDSVPESKRTLLFDLPAGQNSVTLRFPILDDAIPENAQTFAMTLSQANDKGEFTGHVEEALVDTVYSRLMDDDQSGGEFYIKSFTEGREGKQHPTVMIARRDPKTKEPMKGVPITIEYIITGSVAEQMVRERTGSVTFAPDQSEKPATIAVENDDVSISCGATLEFRLSKIVKGAATISPNGYPESYVYVPIKDDDKVELVVERFNVDEYSYFNLYRYGGCNQTASVDYKIVGGTYLPKNIQSPLKGTVTFDADDGNQDMIGLVDDKDYQGDRTVVVELSNFKNGVYKTGPPDERVKINGDKVTVTLTIAENDPKPIVPATFRFVQNEQKKFSGNEDEGVKIGVERLGRLDQTVTLLFTPILLKATPDVPNVADGNDVSAKGVLMFNAGERTKELDYKFLPDNNAEPDETFKMGMTLQTPIPEGVTLEGGKQEATVVILNDDGSAPGPHGPPSSQASLTLFSIPDGNSVYYGKVTNDGFKLVKYSVPDFRLQATYKLADTDEPVAGVVDKKGSVYIGTKSNRVIKLKAADLSPALSPDGSPIPPILIPTSLGTLSCAIIDNTPGREFAYFGTKNAPKPANIVRIHLKEEFSFDQTKDIVSLDWEDWHPFNSAWDEIGAAVIDESTGAGYFGVDYLSAGLHAKMIVKLDLTKPIIFLPRNVITDERDTELKKKLTDELKEAFKYEGVFSLFNDPGDFKNAAIDLKRGYAYFFKSGWGNGFGSMLVQIKLSDFTSPAQISYDGGTAGNFALDTNTDRNIAYLGTAAFDPKNPGKVLKVDLSKFPLPNDKKNYYRDGVTAFTLDKSYSYGEKNSLAHAFVSAPPDSSAYFTLSSLDAKVEETIVKFPLTGALTPTTVIPINDPPDTTPPTVTITSPKDKATVSGTVTVTADATDNVKVSKVEFSRDTERSPFRTLTTNAPYTFDWKTRDVSNGAHTIRARAYDEAGNASAYSTINVTVSNVPPVTDLAVVSAETTDRSIKLTWSIPKSESNSHYFRVYVSKGTAATKTVLSKPVNGKMEAWVTGLEPNVEYSFQVDHSLDLKTWSEKSTPPATARTLPLYTGADVKVLQTPNGWTLTVDGAPYTIKGVTYAPSVIGESPFSDVKPHLRDWMTVDADHNGADSPYDAYLDGDKTTRIGDFRLMKEMGVNTIRLYHHASNNPEIMKIYPKDSSGDIQFNHAPKKEVLQDLFKTYGIRVAMGDMLGANGVGSGVGETNYKDAEQLKRMETSVRQMVLDFKDEPFLLLYILGNENNHPWTGTNAAADPVAYATFVEEMAQMIHKMDPHHPVVVCNGDSPNYAFIKTLADTAKSVDIIGVNSFRNPGFGDEWAGIENAAHKPFLLTEYGDLTPHVQDGVLDEERQSNIHRAAWEDIEAHHGIGGFAHTWLDDWWQDGLPSEHNLGENRINGERINNEWHGIFSQGQGDHSPFLRQKRLVYGMYQELWAGKPAPDSEDDLIPGEYIIKLKKTLKAKQNVTPTTLGIASLEELNKQFGALSLVAWPASFRSNQRRVAPQAPTTRGVNYLRIRLPDTIPVSKVLEDYRKDPAVQYIEPNSRVHMFSAPSDPDRDVQWALTRIRAEQAWQNERGKRDVTIAIIDTGVDLSHRDLRNQLWANDAELKGTPGKDDDNNGLTDDIQGWNFVWEGILAAGPKGGPPQDDNGHGTHCAGIAAAETDNALGIAGVCPGCTIMPLKILDDQGYGDLDTVATAITYAVDQGADVISLSLGDNVKLQRVTDAVKYAYDNNVVVVAAAGNANSNGINYPAAYDSVIAVASTDTDDARSYFSTYGPWVDVAAPGSEIYSTALGGGYVFMSGTSMACPHVAGLAGLVKSKFGKVSADFIRQRILETSDFVDSASPDHTGEIGYGRINAEAALTADIQTHSISVHVTDDKGAPLAHAALSLSGPAQSSTSETNATGDAVFAGLHPSRYAVTIAHPTYAFIPNNHVIGRLSTDEKMEFTAVAWKSSKGLTLSAEPVVALDVDDNGIAHAAFAELGKDGVRYGRYDEARQQFMVEPVDNSRVRSLSLAVDSRGTVHLVYVDDNTKTLRYAKRSGTWSFKDIATSDKLDVRPGIDTDADGTPHIAYVDGGVLQYATMVDGQWKPFAPDPKTNTISATSIAKDLKDGHLFVSFVDSSSKELRYFHPVQNNWYPRLLASGASPDSRLRARASDGRPYVLMESPTGVHLISNVTSDWEDKLMSPLTAPDSAFDLAVDWSGHVYALVRDLKSEGLALAFNRDAGVETKTIGLTTKPGRSAAVEFSLNNVLHLLYFDKNTSQLQYSRFVANSEPHYFVKGHVLDASGQPMADVTVTLSGDKSQKVTTDATGSYEFQGLLRRHYQVTPSKPGYFFEPPLHGYAALEANANDEKFRGAKASELSGTLLGMDNKPLSGKTVRLRKPNAQQTRLLVTKSDGRYSFAGLDNDFYVVDVMGTDTVFRPKYYASFVTPRPLPALNFQAWPGLFIAGMIKDGRGAPLSNIEVTLTRVIEDDLAEFKTTTDSSGMYLFSGLQEREWYRVSVRSANHQFVKYEYVFENLENSQLQADFSEMSQSIVTARILDDTGAPLLSAGLLTLNEKVERLTGPDNNGVYTSVLSDEQSGNVYPVKTGYEFEPPVQSMKPYTFTDVTFKGKPMWDVIDTKLANSSETINLTLASDGRGGIAAAVLQGKEPPYQMGLLSENHGTWSVEPIAMVNDYTNMALAYTSVGEPAVLASTSDGLFVWTRRNSAWTPQKITGPISEFRSFQQLDLAFDSKNVPHVTWSEGGDAHYVDGATGKVADLGNLVWIAMKLDAQDTVHVVGSHYYEIVHHTFKNETHTSETIQTSADDMHDISLDMGPSGDLHIAFSIKKGNVREALYGRLSGGIWKEEVIYEGGYTPHLVLDPTETPHVLFGTDRSFFYAGRVGKQWVQRPLAYYSHRRSVASMAMIENDPVIMYMSPESALQLLQRRTALADKTASGTITDLAGRPMPKATVEMIGRVTYRTQTDEQGQFAFVAPSDVYRIKPAQTGFQFSPPERTVDLNKANVFDAHFTGAPLWNRTLVTTSVTTAVPPSLSVDRNDVPHVAFRTKQGLRYATIKDKEWSVVTSLLNPPVSSLILSMNALEQPELWYTSGDELGETRIVNSSFRASMAKNGNGHGGGLKTADSVVHRCYWEAGQIKWALGQGAEPQITVIDRNCPVQTPLEAFVQPSAAIWTRHVLYSKDGWLSYARSYDWWRWVAEPISGITQPNGPLDGAITADAQFIPHIVYRDTYGALTYVTKVMTPEAVEWRSVTIETGPDLGHYNSIVTDSFGYPHVFYLDRLKGEIRHAVKRDNTWWRETIDRGVHLSSKINARIDSQNRIHLIYVDDVSGELRYLTQTVSDRVPRTYYLRVQTDADQVHSARLVLSGPSQQWAKTHGEFVFKGLPAGRYNLIADIADQAALGAQSYAVQISDNQGLNLRLNDTSMRTWSVNTGSASPFRTMVYDAKDQPHALISSNGTTQYASWRPGGLDLFPLLSYVPRVGALAVSPLREPYAVLPDRANQKLQVAKINIIDPPKAAVLADPVMIDSIGADLELSAALFDSQNRLLVAYRNNGRLKLATVSTNRTFQLEDIGPATGGTVTLAFDEVGRPAILYFNNGLFVTTKVGTGWTPLKILDAVTAGSASMSYEPIQGLHVAYYNPSQRELWRRSPGGTWWLVDSGLDVGSVNQVLWDAQHPVRIVYFDKGKGQIKVARLSDDGAGQVLAGNAQSSFSAATDSQGHFGVLYASNSQNFLWTAADPPVIYDNQAPVVSVVGPAEPIVVQQMAVLKETIKDDGLPLDGQLTRKWKKMSGPGDVLFFPPSPLHPDETEAYIVVDGTYVLRLTVSDGALESFAEVTVVVKPKPLSFITPKENGPPVSGTIRVELRVATDIPPVKVEVLLNAQPLYTNTKGAPYAFDWNTTSVTNDLHLLYAKAYDAQGQIAEAGVIVNVANAEAPLNVNLPATPPRSYNALQIQNFVNQVKPGNRIAIPMMVAGGASAVSRSHVNDGSSGPSENHHVVIDLYSGMAKLQTLVDRDVPSGDHTLNFDMPSGLTPDIYYLHFLIDGKSGPTEKVMVLD